MTARAMTDQIGKAIAAAEAEPVWPAMTEIPVLIQSTGRPAIVALPTDITVAEIGELAAWMLIQARHELATRAAAASPIVVARGRVDR